MGVVSNDAAKVVVAVRLEVEDMDGNSDGEDEPFSCSVTW